jgi:hypothetical protein
MRYRDLFEGMFKTLRVFAPLSSEFIPFLTCHHSITDFEINAFLNQDSYRLLKFVSDLVSIFDTGCFCFTRVRLFLFHQPIAISQRLGL